MMGLNWIEEKAFARFSVEAEAIEALDEATVTSVLEFRFRYLVNAGFGSFSALMLAGRTDIPLETLRAVFIEPVGAAA